VSAATASPIVMKKMQKAYFSAPPKDASNAIEMLDSPIRKLFLLANHPFIAASLLIIDCILP